MMRKARMGVIPPRRGRIVATVGVGVFVATMIFPLIWMLSASFKLEKDVFNYPIEWIPRVFTFENYIKVWTGRYNFPLYYLNTIRITLAVTILQTLVSSMAAYAFAKLRFRLREPLFALFLATMMIPDQVTIVPKFMLLTRTGLYDTHIGLILLLAFSVYGVFLLRQGMMSIPDSLLEAARIDGANAFQVFVRIALPMTRAAILTLVILRFLWTWNDYQNPLLFIRSQKLFPLQLGMSQFASQSGTYYALLMAASVCSLVPLILVFAFGQRYILDGIASGAVKG
ncbi:MAG: carbohydrate ABC transporter permease [Oscillospiraceae bacterium]|jgi:multiple sugar transport system permease protein|nr:carbohydrate ABC transporter permease [Oscillospiraceae bacterium]